MFLLLENLKKSFKCFAMFLGRLYPQFCQVAYTDCMSFEFRRRKSIFSIEKGKLI